MKTVEDKYRALGYRIRRDLPFGKALAVLQACYIRKGVLRNSKEDEALFFLGNQRVERRWKRGLLFTYQNGLEVKLSQETVGLETARQIVETVLMRRMKR